MLPCSGPQDHILNTGEKICEEGHRETIEFTSCVCKLYTTKYGDVSCTAVVKT